MRARIRRVGDSGLLMSYGTVIEPETNLRVLDAARIIASELPRGVEDVIPAYSTVLLIFDPAQTSQDELEQFLLGRPDITDPSAPEESGAKIHSIPVAYGGEEGPDLGKVSAATGLTPDEVAHIHTEKDYRVYFLGFTPGYPYLGGLDPRIRVPRLPTPRTHVAAGSVAIAGGQTGLYPMASPGGWSVIGRTPLRLFDPSSGSPTLLKPGDRVRLRAIEGPISPPTMPEPGHSPTTPLCRIVHPGLYTTVQDGGRRGYMHLGVSRAGAWDLEALRRANGLLGNPPESAALEMTALGVGLVFFRDSVIALGGAETLPIIDGQPSESRGPVEVPAGSHLSLTPLSGGLRAYLAVQGGFDAPVMMGSRSTDTVAGFGGINGRALRTGDVLGSAGERRGQPVHGPRDGEPASTDGKFTVRAIVGPQLDHFSEKSLSALENQSFVVQPDSNRMGLRLKGQGRVPHGLRGPDIVSEGIIPGSIQVPGDGNPIIMGSNAQTTGGYAKIAVVLREDLYHLGQAKPGDEIRFLLHHH